VLLWVCLFCSGFVRVVVLLRLIIYNCFFFLNVLSNAPANLKKKKWIGCQQKMLIDAA
jgi:hypothetical protein